MRINSILPGHFSSLGGPGYVCQAILGAMSDAGIDISLFCVSGDSCVRKPFHRYSMPHWAMRPGYKFFSQDAWARYTEWRYLRSLRDNDISYVWNTTSIETFKAVKSAGHLILTENINTHRATSKAILDAEYQ